jgi:hypothetical protein
MLALLRYRNLRNFTFLTLLSLSGQTNSSVINAVPTNDGHSSARTGEQDQTSPGTSIPVGRLPRRCRTCRSEKKLRLAIRDRDEWRDVWKALNEPVVPTLPKPELPAIDFSREMVVIVAMGWRPTAGYNIGVDRAHEVDDQLEIVVISTSPGHNCLLEQVVTYPIDIAVLPRTELSVVFKETEVVHECK